MNTPAVVPPAEVTRLTGASATAGPAANGHAVPDAAIRLRAFQKWEAAGRPAGDGVTFWLEAERELRRVDWPTP